MRRPVLEITVSLICRHEDGFSDHLPLTGTRSVVVTSEHVMLDSVMVVWRDRRATKNREAGHPWVSSPRGAEWDDKPNHQRQFESWTDFTVDIRTRS